MLDLVKLYEFALDSGIPLYEFRKALGIPQVKSEASTFEKMVEMYENTPSFERGEFVGVNIDRWLDF